jgi:glycerol-3-phosphate O-acyltransferase
LKELSRPIQIINTRKKWEPILLDKEEWPVVQLARNRKNFIERVANESFDRIKKLRPTLDSLVEELETTRYRERMRCKTNPWKVDPEDEIKFWEDIKKRLVGLENEEEPSRLHEADKILLEIINRYANEIAGNFKPSHYRMARTAVKFFFSRLLNASKIKRFGSFWSKEYTLQDKIQITGETEQLRKLAKIGTVVMVPTHFSNLDSIVIGYVINTLGLPPFIYGAGLNLFNIEIFAYFMNSLGAYKVDRRKKNLIYLETLRTYSSLAIRDGIHSLFFPGGTRSRSGKLETRLKLGLLGTSIEAQRINYENNTEGRRSKIFIVPVVLNYNFVLEAPGLIRDYLERKGQERYYVEADRYSTSSRILKFMIEFFTKGSNISASVGRGMDLFGNYVDDQGMSIDKHGNRVNTRDYFMFKGKISADPQREEEYTRMISDVIVKEFHRINRVFASHLVAFTAFQMMRKRHSTLDLYGFLRIPVDEIEIDYNEFREVFDKLRDRVIELYNENKVDMATHLTGDIDEVIDLGIMNVGMYHSKRPLMKNKSGHIVTQDLNNLYYYHNRMDGYDLERYI